MDGKILKREAEIDSLLKEPPHTSSPAGISQLLVNIGIFCLASYIGYRLISLFLPSAAPVARVTGDATAAQYVAALAQNNEVTDIVTNLYHSLSKAPLPK